MEGTLGKMKKDVMLVSRESVALPGNRSATLDLIGGKLRK